MNKIIKAFGTALLVTSVSLAWAATPLTDAEFSKGVKPSFALKDCKKLDGIVVAAEFVSAERFEGKFHVFVSAIDTPDGTGYGTYMKRPSQAQLDSLKGLKYCHVP